MSLLAHLALAKEMNQGLDTDAINSLLKNNLSGLPSVGRGIPNAVHPQGFTLSNLNSGSTPTVLDNLLALYNNDPSPSGAPLVWNGVPIPKEELAELKVVNGALKIPVVTEGKIDPFWNVDPNVSLTEPVEAGKAQGLSVTGADANTSVLLTKSFEKGVIRSKKFPIPSNGKTLDLRMIGSGDMASTFLSLKISIDGGPAMGWAKQAPTSNSSFEKFSVDISRILERAGGKEVVGQFEIVDGGASRVIGIAGMENLSNISRSSLHLFPRTNLLLGDYHLSPFYLNFSQYGQTTSKSGYLIEIDNNLSSQTTDYYLQAAYRVAISQESDFVQGYKVRDVANLLTKNVKRLMVELGQADNKNLESWMLAEALCAWTSTRVVNATDIPNGGNPSEDYEKIRRGQSGVVLEQTPPSANCSGVSRLTRDIGRAMGLQVVHVGGYLRLPGEAPPPSENHGWVVFSLKDAIGNTLLIPADPSSGLTSIKDARGINGKINEHLILPRSQTAMEIFLATHFAYYVLDGWGQATDTTRYQLSNMPLSQWRSIDSNYLKSVVNKFERSQLSNIHNR